MIDLDGIEAIIFDLGGVIINIDYQLTIDAFESLGVHDFKTQYSKKQQSKLFDQLETGKISPDEFVKYIKKDLGLESSSDEQILSAWNALLLDFPLHRLSLLRSLREQFSLYLLSNTNEIHVKEFHKILEHETGYRNLESFFLEVYFSNEIGQRKPNPEVFKWLLKENGLQANSTLFIDDSIQHIKGAQSIGIKTYHLKEGEDIVQLFPKK